MFVPHDLLLALPRITVVHNTTKRLKQDFIRHVSIKREHLQQALIKKTQSSRLRHQDSAETDLRTTYIPRGDSQFHCRFY